MDNAKQNFISNIGNVMKFLSENHFEMQWLIEQAQSAEGDLGYLRANDPDRITQEDIDGVPSFAEVGVTVADLERGIDVITTMRNFGTAWSGTVSKLSNLP